MERARRPRHQGRLEAADASAEARNPLCGDRMSLQVALTAEGRIGRVAHQARACAICAASVDLMAEMVAGAAPDEVAAMAEGFETALRQSRPIPAESPLVCFQPLSAVPSRIACALLGWQALLSALGSARS